MVQGFAYIRQRPLADNGLDNVVKIFENAGNNDGSQINAAVME
jgi:hypothetical protein